MKGRIIVSTLLALLLLVSMPMSALAATWDIGKGDITGYQYEPWHIRYVGVDTAKEIDQLGVSLEEYLGVQSEYTGPWEH